MASPGRAGAQPRRRRSTSARNICAGWSCARSHGGERGHVGSSMSLIEIMRVLYDDILRYRADEPKWPDRDRMILSKGHGCLALYVMLADKGFFPLETLDTFCRRDSILGGHPEAGEGSRRRSLDRRARPRPVDRRRHGAGGSHREARQPRLRGDGRRRDQRGLGVGSRAVRRQAQARQSHRLIDYNKIQSAGPTREIQDLEPLLDKWRAFDFAAVEVDGHDVAALRRCLRSGCRSAPTGRAPIICHTVKGKGISFAENDANWHHKSKIAKDVVAQAVRRAGVI